jgi:hypothetical protein
MAITKLVATRLTDRRVQLFASKDDGTVWSTWKTGVDPDSSWMPWQRFDLGTPRTTVVGTGELSNGASQLFGLADQPVWPVANLISGKVSADPNAAWSGWVGLGFGGNCTDITAQRLTDGRMQIFALAEASFQGASRLLSRWKTGVDPNSPLSGVADMTPAGVPGLSSIVAARLSDGRIQLVGGTNDRLVSTWKMSTDPNAAWLLPWTDFMSMPVVNSTTQLAWAPLSDGRPQIWSVNRFGTLSSTWKATTDPNSAWITWSEFDAPDNITSFAAEPLSDGRIQLFAVDSAGAIFSTWKMSTDPNAKWLLPWQPFPAP